MNVLAIGAHFDDVELGCGGALAKHVQNGDHVVVFIATNSEFCSQDGTVLRSRDVAMKEAENASKIIGYHLICGDIPTFYLEYAERVNKELVRIIEENKVDLVYTHWNHDIHHDHRNLSLSTLHAARHVKRVLMYHSNFYISEEPFHRNFYIDISNTWEIKEKAVRAYQSEIQRVGVDWLTYFRQEACNNGLEIGVKYAEAFQMVKWIL